MSILTLNSTFNDIKNLLKDEDICFKKTIKKTFEEVSKDEERKNAFCFFMAMALGGVGTLDEKGNVTDNNINEKFLKIIKIKNSVYLIKEKKTKAAKQSEKVGGLIQTKKEKRDKKRKTV